MLADGRDFFFIVLNCQKYIKILKAGNFMSVKLEILLAYETKKSRNHTESNDKTSIWATRGVETWKNTR